MANEELNDLLQLPLNALSSVLGAAESGRRVVTGLGDAIISFQRAAKATEQVAQRVNGLLDDIEGPIRSLIPGIERLAQTLDAGPVRDLPETLESFRAMIGGLSETLTDLPRRLGPFAELLGGADRLLGLGRMLKPNAPNPPTPPTPPSPGVAVTATTTAPAAPVITVPSTAATVASPPSSPGRQPGTSDAKGSPRSGAGRAKSGGSPGGRAAKGPAVPQQRRGAKPA